MRSKQHSLRGIGALGLTVLLSHSSLVLSFSLRQLSGTATRIPGVHLKASVVASPPSSPILQDDFDDVAKPRGAKNDWEVHKFGGASLATAELYRTVGDLLIRESEGREHGTIPTMAIVSARGGMTDLLVKVVDSALLNFEQAIVALQEAVESQVSLLKELAPPEITDPIEARFRSDGQDILSVVQSLRMLHTVPAVTMEVVTGFGEIWSAQTLHAYLQTQNVPCEWIDARDILVVKSDSSGLGEKGAASTGGVTPLYEITTERLSHWWNNEGRNAGFLDLSYEKGQVPIVIVTGFVAQTIEGVPTTLKRSGSDYSATIFAKLVNAGRVTMWKNTDGVYTADPRRVPEAFPIASLKYDEAMELAYFGAQVLHPSAMEPCIDKKIPVYVRNIFNPDFEGTIIQGRCATLKDSFDSKIMNWRSKSGFVPIKGITSVDKIALVSLEGASIGGANVAERFMGAMADNDIKVLIITQASSESSITVAVPENEGQRALQVLENVFELELSRSKINSLSVATGMSIVAIVGEGMAMTSGVSATFMTSLSSANVNIRLIAQGSSERQIAVVVAAEDTTSALRAAHMAFTLSETTATITLLGCTGNIGSALVRQLQEQKTRLAQEFGVSMCINIAANSKKMVVGENSQCLDVDNLSSLIKSDEALAFDLDKITNLMMADVHPLRIVIDCTNSEAVSEYYERWLSSGINIISPSRKVAAGNLERYKCVRAAEKANSVSWLYESSVGSALPICTTLQDLYETGDKVKSITGCVSGTMAYVLSSFSEDVPFSEALRAAVEKRITENDVWEDLSGMDMAQKVVILARSMGMNVNLEDVEVEFLIPEEFLKKEYPVDWNEMTAAQLEDIKCMDALMLERLKAATAEGRRLRYKFLIDKETGKCKCSLVNTETTDPLYRLKLYENLVAFETSRYETSPLIVKGAAAGPDLASAGIFADLLRLTRSFSSNQG
ncbi:bifunctional aspartokinase/homoserine dehydrogenase II [Nitzschia inconspicua]|uniref:Bifunctional aspartokinase/homoserine dehydrogenase II n=1 Tax=Nitzschia inconspicua TaxID=303405 RepID=A0A9K3Q867_9STRA|nr:bifunctional aspartokinase/homoserine dehydrogenase II [Nitzschia inconspicua]